VGPKGHRERVEMTLFAMAGRRYGLMLRSIEEEIEREDRYLDRIDRMDGEHRAILTDLHHGHVFDRLIRTQGFERSLSQAMANPLAYLRGDLETLEEYFKKIVTLQQAYELLIKDLRFDEQPHLLPRLNVVKSLRKRYDLDFLREDVKKVIAEAGDGIGQLTQINQALNLLRSDEEVGDLGAQVHAAIEAALLLLSGCYVSHFTVHYSGVEELPAVAMSSDRLMLMFLEVLAVAIDSLENRLSPEEGELHIDGRVTEKGIYLSIHRRFGKRNGFFLCRGALPHP
jgi:signal transduction histidine kinase